MKKHSIASSLPSWDLSDLFKNLKDPNIGKQQKQVDKQASAFHHTYHGKVANLTAKQLKEALEAYESLLQEAEKPYHFASLLFSADSQTPEHGIFLQRVRLWYQTIFEKVVFFDLELGNHAQLELLAKNPLLKHYSYFLERQLILRKHRLPENEEKILSEKAITGHSAFVRLFDEEESAQRFSWKKKGKVVELSRDQLLDYLHDAKHDVRKRASELFTSGLKSQLKRVTFITNTLAQDKISDDTYRKFSSPEAARHLDNRIDQKTVDTMSSVVTDHYEIVQDYYRFKKKLLGISTLYDYDRYAPLPTTQSTFSFSEAKTIILNAYHGFSPTYADTAKAFFDGRWIDAAHRPGKRGGAFCAYTTPDLHPYVLVNFGEGNAKQVLTLAHELGHGIHASLAREQTYLNFDHPLTIAETASIFGEMLTFYSLRDQLKSKKDKLALSLMKIEEMFATVFRQISMYRFEQDLHGAIREKTELTPEEVSALWRKRQAEMFGSSVTLTPNYDVWWSYVSHFLHTPFYVYAYAFGELLTLSLFAQYKKEGSHMAEKYLNLLRAGGSKSPQDLVTPFGIDLTKKAFWEQGIELLKGMIAEAKELAK